MIILPNVLVPQGTLVEPLFFLAGPVRGGGNWQLKAHSLLVQQMQGACSVVIPCRYKPGDPLYGLQEPGRTDVFERQVLWERYYLELASRRGCIAFWLPVIDKSSDVAEDPDFCYARDTRGELGEWRGRDKILKELCLPRPKMVVGAEVGFPGLSVIQANFDDALGENYPIYTTLPETIRAAVELARS